MKRFAFMLALGVIIVSMLVIMIPAFAQAQYDTPGTPARRQLVLNLLLPLLAVQAALRQAEAQRPAPKFWFWRWRAQVWSARATC